MREVETVKVVESVAEMQVERARLSGDVGLVPTMGALHDGHLSLVRRARRDSDHVVVSIFVNPTQFGSQEDYHRYPRDREGDLKLLSDAGVDVAFVPSVEEIYPPGFDEWVELDCPAVSRLEGAGRPGHIRGVTTVVARLFRIVQPQRAYFGQKDAQQLLVVRRMVRELGLPVEVVPVPTVRDSDGLALSSRNAYLSPEERQAALVLPRALDLAHTIVEEWGRRDADLVRQSLEDYVRREPQVELEYVSVSDSETLEELETIDRAAFVLLAARVGATRLIDNTLVVPAGVEAPEALRGLAGDAEAARRG